MKTRTCVVVLVLELLASTHAHAQALPATPPPAALAPGPLIFATAENQHRAVIAGRIALVVTLALDVKAAWQCPARVRCLIVVGVRPAATVAIAEAIKHWAPVARPCAPTHCGDDPPYADVPSEDTAIAVQALGFFDQGGRCGAARSWKHASVSVSTATLTAGFRRASWRHDLKGLLAGAGLGTGVDYLTAYFLC